MAACITNCLLEWGLDNVFTITVDNASSNDVTVKEMSKQLSNWGTNIMDGDHLHVRCMAHILNLIVQDGLKEIGKSIKLVRQAVKYIKQSPARIRKFKECCESQLIACKKSLCLDVPTRWNSTYLMVDVAQHFELSFERYSFYDIGYLNHFRTFGSNSSEGEDGTNVDILTSVNWKNVRSMVKFIETFYVPTLKISDSNYVTSNTHFVEIAELNLILKEMMENEDGNLKEMRKNENETTIEKHKEVSGSSGSKSELESYLAEDIKPNSDGFDILMWWKVNELRFPILAEMVRDVLAIPISSVASLTPKLVQSLICV
ncbi:zinc finger BED domain-containing protein RICESLEEPER 4-like [Solanum tuberosum]|uniref:zinc finger BED domain-containing protein RICESLEEPER 4-like n=1 Tax=Solanum tuberosum TaxID=4113 RepID=UPI00073A18C0|nr:PREDICTED: zinc finger BED domain-containing protein RICESLEEPER 4-like [Solanum tuberosum]